MSPFYEQIYTLIRAVPEGRVTTYGRVARRAGRPRAARQVGYALAALPEDNDVPWQRVVNARGEISARGPGGCEDIQRVLLEEEGVVFRGDGRIDLSMYGWYGDDDNG